MLRGSKIRLLQLEDEPLLVKYLAPNKSKAMFVCSNLDKTGVEYKGKTFEGEYFGCFAGGGNLAPYLIGFIVHYWNGNIMMHAENPEILKQLTLYLKKHTKRKIMGILGISHHVNVVIDTLGLSKTSLAVNRAEGLYDLDLSSIKDIALSDYSNIVPANGVDPNILLQWMIEYEKETLGAIENDQLHHRVNSKIKQMRAGDCFLLTQNNVPVSLVGFNAKFKDIIQIGPVWTPLKYRNHGFAKRLLANMLLNAKACGIKRAILFTANPAAIKVYETIGFNKIGVYRITLLREH